MADKKMNVDGLGLYQYIARDLQKMRNELLREMRYSSVQTGSLYQEMKADKEKSASAISQEIRYSYKQNQTIYDGLTALLTKDVAERLNAMDEKVSALEHMQTLLDEVKEIKYSYMQLQAIYEEIGTKLQSIEEKESLLEQIDRVLGEVHAKLYEAYLPTEDDYKKFADSITEKTEEHLVEHSRQVLDAVAAIPVAENVDYHRIVDEVGDKFLEILNELKDADSQQAVGVASSMQTKIDYDRIASGAAEKVVESLPFPEKVQYARIQDDVAKVVAKAVDVNAIAEACASKIVMPEIDYDRLAEACASKMVMPEIDYDRLADVVVAKLTDGAEQSYDVALDDAGLTQIAEKVAEKLNLQPEIDYDRIDKMLDEKLVCEEPCEEPTYDLLLDEEGIHAIAKSVSEELCRTCATCAKEEPQEEAPVEEVEEVVETPVEEVVEETVVEEPVAPVEEELATAETLNLEDQLVDAETGLVIRLKKSFTAKMCQSEEEVKGYYSDVKNALKSYKRINSNVSWHGDRFNYGRETVAKLNICGKTLCFYLALDPNDPEFKTTVYHQKDVGAQKAYENTPFMVKIKSAAAAKKALRLVGYLADKLAAEKEENFEAVDYVEAFAYQSTKQLFDDGFIKATKEKKVDLNF
ncbi:MAG: hypothetical protein J6A38_03370 [Clostridia bacterium]|nr:hypothetical protein [Clostridia bacterium]